MSAIGTMVINLMARTEAFEKSMDRASGKIASFERRAKGLERALSTGFKMGGALTAINQIADAAMKTQDAATASGTAAQKWASDFLDMIPILGGVIEKYEQLTDVMLGMTEATEKVKLQDKFSNKAKSLEDELIKISKEYENINKTDEEKELIKALEKQAEIRKKIDEYTSKKRMSGEWSINRFIEEKKRLQAEFDAVAAAENNTIKAKYREKEIEAAKKDEEELQASLNKIQKQMAADLAEQQTTINKELDTTKSPQIKAAEDLAKKLETVNEWYKKNLITSNQFNDLSAKYNDDYKKTMAELNAKDTKTLDSGEFKQFNASDISVKGLAIRSGTEMYQQQIAKNTAKTAENTGKTTGALV